jgi:dihydroflavonol-4-reductase
MKVFLTGATGFVGHHVARALAAEGAQLRLLVRKSSNLANLEGIAGDTHVGDLSQPETLKPALVRVRCGCACGRRLPALDSRSCEAMYKRECGWHTRELLRMAREAQVPRVCLYVERGHDALSHGWDRHQRGHAGFAQADMVGHYKRSKFLAEQEADCGRLQAGQQVMILNPTTPDRAQTTAKPTPTGRIILDFLNGKFPAYTWIRGSTWWMWPRLRRTHVAALTKGQAGTALYSWWREPDAQADSGQDGGDYGDSFADGEDSFCGCGDLCVL